MSLDVYDKIMMLAKRRGFIYPSFEIYGGTAGFYDYGPLGSRLKQNLENLWRKLYLLQDNCIEIETPTITPYEVLKASGHVDQFTDLVIYCKKCDRSFKVEDIIPENSSIEQAVREERLTCPVCGFHMRDPYRINLMFSTTIGIGNGRDAFLRPETAQGIFIDFHHLYRYEREKLPFGVIQVGKGYRSEVSPRQGIIRLREFSMAEAEIFFDPEEKTHSKFDTVKEKELILFDNQQQLTVSLEKAVEENIINNQALAYYMYLTQEFLLEAGVDPQRFRFRKHAADELAHYATECWDAELYSERFGWVECVGIADRTAYDLNAHILSSYTNLYAWRKFDRSKTVRKQKIVPKMNVLGPLFKDKAGEIKNILETMEPMGTEKLIVTVDGKRIEIPKDSYEILQTEEKMTGEKFIPHVIEPSYGIDRILYYVLEHNYVETMKKGEEYRILRLKPSIAPIKTGVFPLINDSQLVEIATEIDQRLRNVGIPTYYDDRGTIGRRYARMDEVGTPFCVTVDHKTIEDDTVTIRDRDTTEQERKNISKLVDYIHQLTT